jgi:uncharacterized protein YfdQ (DUF2303 family)
MTQTITVSGQQSAESIMKAAQVLETAIDEKQPAVALPDNFSVCRLEHFYSERLIPRGALKLSFINEFVRQVQEGHTVFVDRDSMSATTYLDEDPMNPGLGHYQNSVVLALKPTPEKLLLDRFKKPVRISQQEAAELFEDYYQLFFAEGKDGIAIGRALRHTKLQATQSSDHTVGNLSATKSTLETIEAKAGSGNELPSKITCTAQLFENLPEFVFEMRLGVVRQTSQVEFVLSVICWNELITKAATEFVEVLKTSGVGSSTVLVGTFNSEGK